jgi:hypothetical protein
VGYFGTVRIAVGILLLCSTAGASAQIAVRSATIQEREVARGETYSGSVSVENGTDAPARVRLYLTDYTFTADSGSRFSRASALPRSNARWIVVSASELVIPPHRTMPVSYSVHVPTADSLAGTYWTVLMVESVPDRPPGDARKNEVALATVLRYAVQIVSHIGAAADRTFEITDPKITTTDDGASAMQLDLRNNGRRAARLRVVAELYDETGTKRGQFAQSRGLIYPGASVRQHFTFGVLPAGRFKILVTLDAGDDALFASQYTFSR